MELISKQNKAGWAVCLAFVLSVVSLIVYLVTSNTGFLAGRAVNAVPTVLTIVAILLCVAVFVVPEKLGKGLGVAIVVAGICLIASLCVFVLARVNLFADVYFIPVNYPEAEEQTLNASIVGFVFYILAIVAMIFAGFSDKTTK